MADVASAFRLVLLDDSDVSNAVGTRIIPDQLAQGETLPAITYRRISTRHEKTIEGSKARMAISRISCECFAATRAAADALAELVRLSGVLDWRGVQHGVDARNVEVDSGISHLTEQNTEGSHELRYITEIDFEITFREAV
jgi:hypothetical protein